MELLGKVFHEKDAETSMDEQELVRLYLQTDKITFGSSRLKPGAVGGLDPGHKDAHEVFFCAKGHVLCYFPEDNHYYELKEGDALLIPPSTGHKLYNIGDEEALITWSCAPRPNL
jgi:mannose-6-phosphate isomerase-like protein (cupin superfamily)